MVEEDKRDVNWLFDVICTRLDIVIDGLNSTGKKEERQRVCLIVKLELAFDIKIGSDSQVTDRPHYDSGV